MKKYQAYLPYLAGLVMALIFGLSFMFTKQALETLPTTLLLAYRFALAAILLTLLWLFGAIKVSYKNKPLKELLLLSLFQPIAYFIFETTGVKLTSSSEAGIMIALIPVVVTIFAAIFLKEKPGRAQLFFILASVLGVVFIVLMSGSNSSAGHYAGILSLCGAVLAAGVYNILSRKLSSSFTPVEITFVMMWTGAVVFNMISAVTGVINGNLDKYISSLGSASTLVPVLYLGTLSSVCAFFMVNYMLSKLPASNSSVFSNLTTVISIIAGVLIRHEAFHWYQLAGGIIIILGVWGTNRYKPQQEIQLQATESL
ncbi:MAG TPA: DMT family transporter [Clostridia bacterium]|nr:DMT family transporter [Clostridia bacterium]